MAAISVVVATCGRPHDLRECIHSLLEQTSPASRIVVVDDAPGGDETPAVVSSFDDPALEYVAGAREGLAAAHNRGLRHVQTPLVAFTDDDVIADPGWLEHLCSAFATSTTVGCVTGRIVPRELETPAQKLLEAYAGFDKGSARRTFDLYDHRPSDPLFPFTAGTLGSGANMAFRRSSLLAGGDFDPALGTGTRARGGDDLSAFLEVILRGERLVYEPAAVVRHRHPREMDALERQVFGYGVGLTAYLARSLAHDPHLITAAARRLPAGIGHALRQDSAKNSRLPVDYPARLKRLERLGMLLGPFAYLRSRITVGRREVAR